MTTPSIITALCILGFLALFQATVVLIVHTIGKARARRAARVVPEALSVLPPAGGGGSHPPAPHGGVGVQSYSPEPEYLPYDSQGVIDAANRQKGKPYQVKKDDVIIIPAGQQGSIADSERDEFERLAQQFEYEPVWGDSPRGQ